MDGKALGFVAARGLAALSLVNAVERAVTNYAWVVQSHVGDDPSTRWGVVAAYITPIAYVIAALALWFGASRFGPDDTPAAPESLSVRSAVGLAMTGVGIYVLIAHMGGLIGFIWESVVPNNYHDARPAYWADLSGCILAGVLIAIGRQNLLTTVSGKRDARQQGEP